MAKRKRRAFTLLKEQAVRVVRESWRMERDILKKATAFFVMPSFIAQPTAKREQR